MRYMAWLFLVACKFEDGTQAHGEMCAEDEDCEEGLRCSLWACLLPKGSLGLDESCVRSSECEDELFCSAVEEVCIPFDDDEDDDGGGGGILCNDGTRSPTCTTCSQGCCSSHGGCR